MRVLVVEDYLPMRRSLQRGLQDAGFTVDVAKDGEEGLFLAQANTYDAMILDVLLPKVDGMTILKQVRTSGRRVPVLILTACDSVTDRVYGLDHGADDCLSKPFAVEEMLARVRALVRRSYPMSDPVIRLAHVEIDTAARCVRVAGETVTVTAREYSLLELLARRQGELVTRGEIFDHCFGFEADASSNVIDVYIGYLRKKIERATCPRLIHTRRGQGYQMLLSA
jgi:DNA-binding response OmpR family regulator